MIHTALVNLKQQRVGAVAWDAERRCGLFEFEPSFVKDGPDIAPLKMPLQQAAGRIFTFPELRDSNTFKGLPGLLADVFPDRYGHTLINAWLARNGRPADSLNPVELLCFIGKRGMGALEFEPVQPAATSGATKIELESLIEVARQILSGKKNFRTRIKKEEEKTLLDVLKIGTSAGGARAKAVIAYNSKTSEVRSGQAEAPTGFEHWLLKFDGITDAETGSSQGYGRVEMAYYLMAQAAGINMSECRLLEENGRAHFMTKRFDRRGPKEKIHVQSFCAMSHFDFNNITDYSYEQLFETMRSLLLPYSDAEQLFRRMVFNVAGRNCDDHTKNFAFIMNPRGEWRLSPAYDLCHAYRPDSSWVSQHSLSINGKRRDIRKKDILALAGNMNIKKPLEIIDEVNDAVGTWQRAAKETGVNAPLRKAIAGSLVRI